MVPLRLAFLGTPNFAVPTLDALVAAGHEILCVYSQPPRPSGRGKRVQPSPVQAFAAARGFSVRTPVSVKPKDEQQAFAALDLDAAVVAAYGLILPDAVLEAPRLGCLNLHASLLPRWRGAAPIQRAILAGDRETGVTIMQVEQALDSGPILRQQAVPIQPDATAASLHDELAARGAALMVEALEALAQGKLPARPQPAEGITYAKKLNREEGRLDWQRPAVELERQVRAFAPWPGAFTTLPGRDGPEPLKVLAARVVALRPDEGAQVPGRVLDDALTVACGADALRLVTVQRPGKSAMPAARFLRGFPLAAGCQLGGPAAKQPARSR